MKKLAEGIYTDDAGTLHLDLPEICRAAGVEPTTENQDRLQAAAVAMFEGSAEVEVRDGEGGGRWRQRASCTHGMPTPASCVECMNDDGLGPPLDEPAAHVESIFTARFDGDCSVCDLPIREGQRIARLSNGRYAHAGCP